MEKNADAIQDTNIETSVDNSTESGSDFDLESKIGEYLGEPTEDVNEEDSVAQEEPTVPEKKDNTEECPVKFKNEDGSVNVDSLLKSYKEIEHLVNEKSVWQKERAELLESKEKLEQMTKEINERNEEKARNAGYESAEDMQHSYDVAYVEANEYAKYLRYVDDPVAVKELLIKYANNPSEDLMEQIELEFAPAINKKVAVASEQFKQQYENQKLQDQNTMKISSMENVVKQSAQENRELFEYQPFKNLFIDTLSRYGENFTFEDSKRLMTAFEEMKDVLFAEFEKQYGIKKENDGAKEKIASIGGTYSAPVTERYSNEDISKMSKEELSKAISKYI